MTRQGARRGYTLIELMIVVAVIGALASIAVPKFASALRNANEAATKGKLGAIRTSLQIYYADTEGQYPSDLTPLLQPGSRYLTQVVPLYTGDHGSSNDIHYLPAIDAHRPQGERMEPVLNAENGCEDLSKRAALVSRYATPLAVLLVALGVAISQPVSPVKELSIGLLVFGLVFNYAALPFISKMKDPSCCVHIRVFVNLAANALIVYLLGGYWKPAWLLLALTPLATAVYDSWNKTLASSLVVGALLLLIEATRKLSSPLEWAETAANALFIVLVSLLVNELAHHSRSERA
ncbi:MAG: prepilin-type N-terminal cleavage/methylation domain-containing protein [Elusimicrobiota bacterium]|jgi:prepilin-type N-terminal cleavage/methylation domain-containing protein